VAPGTEAARDQDELMPMLKLCTCGALVQRTPCPTCRRSKERKRGTTTQRGLGADHQRLRAIAIARHPYCSECGATEDLTADHIIPRSKGGQNVLSNYRVLCGHHNYSKGAA
jgi:5-methylcytosine-specific restriction protein A